MLEIGLQIGKSIFWRISRNDDKESNTLYDKK